MVRNWVLLLCATWIHNANAGDLDAEALRQQGLAEYEIGHYAVASDHFRHAAELGDARSAEILTLMYRYGERLYGNQIRADLAEARRWAAMAAERHFRPIATTKTTAH